MKRKWPSIAGVLVLLVGIGVWSARDTFATARIGTTYVAKQTCSCLFVAGRPLDSCSRFDLVAGRVRERLRLPSGELETINTASGGTSRCSDLC